MKTKTTIKKRVAKPKDDGRLAKESLTLARALQASADRLEAGTNWRVRAGVVLDDMADRREAGTLPVDELRKSLIRVAQIERADPANKDFAFFVIAHFTERIAEDMRDDDPECQAIYKAIKEVEAKYGIEDGDWPEADCPVDAQALFDADWKLYYKRWSEVLRRFGEDEMADMLVNDYDRFDKLYERGRVEVYGPLPKDLNDLVKTLPDDLKRFGMEPDDDKEGRVEK